MPQRGAWKARTPPPTPKLTREEFEKELKALAASARQRTWARWAREQFWILLRAAMLLSLAAIYSNVSQLTLSPVFGSIPASIYHSKGVIAACFLGWSSNLFFSVNLGVKPLMLLPILAAYIPVIQFP